LPDAAVSVPAVTASLALVSLTPIGASLRIAEAAKLPLLKVKVSTLVTVSVPSRLAVPSTTVWVPALKLMLYCSQLPVNSAASPAPSPPSIVSI
jgi:hypothetical protein